MIRSGSISLEVSNLGPLRVNREAGMIEGVSVVTAGPALGHGFEVDDEMLRQVAVAVNATPQGLRVRITHPSSGGFFDAPEDPLPCLVGRLRNARVEGDRVRADVVIGRYAEHSPRGNMREFLLGLAEEDPEALGLSIVFVPAAFDAPLVTNGLPRGRVKTVEAVDFVGEPAANPAGLLSRKEVQMVANRKKLADGAVPDLSPEAGEEREAFVERFGNDPDMQAKYPDAAAKAAQAGAIFDAHEKAVAGETPSGPDPTPTPTAMPTATAMPGAMSAQQAVAAVTLERRRVGAIYKLQAERGLPKEWADGMVSRCVPLATVEELVKMSDQMIPVRVGADKNLSSLAPAMTDAILLRAGRKIEKPHERAVMFSSLSLVDIYRHWLSAHGVVEAFELSRIRIVDLMSPRKLRRAYQLAQSTSDFDEILRDAINKSLRQAYLDAPTTWNIWARRNTAPDFKTIYRPALSESPNLVARTEGAEFKYVTLGEGAETYALVEYAGGLLLTRRAIINDDLAAFDRIPTLQANAAARLEDDTAYAILTANANMADGGALFNTTAVSTTGGHANLVATGGTTGGAPTVITMSATEKLMMKQKGPKSAARLELRARYMLVPTSIYRVSQQVVASVVDPAKSNAAMNPFANEGLTIVPSARLDDSDSAAWYFLADTNLIDTVEVCFLQDEQQPVLEQETDFDTDDVKFKVRHTVAAAALDFRGMVKNPGA
ncbi:MAG TPA: hypothetical protein VMY69_08855 [Phycisphaerae bacterium]|nr:hypothetical protein [Phycisphaerae bacterium]